MLMIEIHVQNAKHLTNIDYLIGGWHPCSWITSSKLTWSSLCFTMTKTEHTLEVNPLRSMNFTGWL